MAATGKGFREPNDSSWPANTPSCRLPSASTPAHVYLLVLPVAGTSRVTIARLVMDSPYRSLFESSSGRSVAPSSEIPAKTPRARDQLRISACICASVDALDPRRTGLAAAAASAPIVNLLDKS